MEIIDNEVWLHVIVRLKDNSGIEITGTKEEKIELMEQRDEWFKPEIDKVLSTLSEEDINGFDKLSDGFGTYISENDFDKLVKDEKVRKIIWPKTGADVSQNEILLDNWNSIVLTLAVIFLVLVLLLYFVIKKKFTEYIIKRN